MSNMDGNLFNNGTPKYSSAIDIYDALHEMSNGEEISILTDIFADISWDGQNFYYIDNADKLIERWDQLTNEGNVMWLMDVAAWQLTDEDANDLIYQILCNEDLSKRIGFKKLFTDNVLGGFVNQYEDAVEAFANELQELNRFDFYSNTKALEAALKSINKVSYNDLYGKLASAVYSKLKGLKLDTERQLIVESRAMLTGYDDFIFGLRANQALYQTQEIMYKNKVKQLQDKYEDTKRLLLSIAQKQGVALCLSDSPLLLIASSDEVTK